MVRTESKLKVDIIGLDSSKYLNKPNAIPLSNIKSTDLPPGILPLYLEVVLCNNYNTYTSPNTNFEDVYRAIYDANIPGFLESLNTIESMRKENQNIYESFLFHYISNHLKGNGIEICNGNALYNLINLPIEAFQTIGF